jgi:branched-chain amino acid transport system ATP-binding protein
MNALLAIDALGAGTTLDGVTLSVAAGTCLGVIGANGAGKSTLLRAIIGLERARCGSIRFAGQDITALPAEERARCGIGYVPEGRRVFASLTTRENLLVGCRAGRAEARNRLDAAFTLFPALVAKANERAWRLSGGQQQMVAIARALMGAPKLVLLDEPSLGLGPQVIDELAERLAAIRTQGTAVILAEPNLALATTLADRLVLLAGGVSRETTAHHLDAYGVAGLYARAGQGDTRSS